MKDAISALRNLLTLCENANPGAWHNGVSHNGTEEGDHIAEKIMDDARQVLDAALAKKAKAP